MHCITPGDEIGEFTVIVEGKVNVYSPVFEGGEDHELHPHSGEVVDPDGCDVEDGAEASEEAKGAVVISGQPKAAVADEGMHVGRLLKTLSKGDSYGEEALLEVRYISVQG